MTTTDPDLNQAQRLLLIVSACITIFVLTVLMVLLFSSCQSLPQLCRTVDDIATDDAITVEVDRSAIQKETDVHITVDVKNKQEPQPFVVHSAPAQ